MLLFPNTRVELSLERPVLPGITIENEGSALIASYSGGTFGVQESLGAAGEVFVGVSLSRPMSPADAPVVEVLTVSAGGTVTLKAGPLAGTTRVLKNSTGLPYTVVAIAPAAATEAQVVAGSPTVTFQTGQAGQVVTVTYRRSLTVAQAIMMIGNQDIGGPAGAYMGQVGVLTRGDVYTSEFDTLADWTTTPGNLRLGANGKFTMTGTGVAVPGYIISVPSEGNPWLGLHIAAV